MTKSFRITLNIVIFVLIIGFVCYMVGSLGKQEPLFGSATFSGPDDGISAYKKINAIRIKSDIIAFDLTDEHFYVAVDHAVLIYDKSGANIKQIPVGKEIRDIKVDNELIYLLYPAKIESFTSLGEKVAGWEARRKNSDYCAMALSSEYIYVTDAENKNICQYTKEGDFIATILSPNGFVIPGYSFDIILINDTIYCSNSGRHQIERFTLTGKYIDSFGKAGTEAGCFVGCCNPVYLAASQNGDILTSEKGSPRISCFTGDGLFKTTIFDNKTLGGGVQAYRLKTQDDRIFIAGKNTLSAYVFDPRCADRSSCAGCPFNCPLKQ